MHTFADMSVLIFSFIVINIMPAGYCSKGRFIDAIKDFKWKLFSSKILPSSKPTFLFMETYWF